MNTFQKVIFAVFLAISFSSCLLREADRKPDTTLVGKQLFLNAESNIVSLISLSNFAFKLETYRNTPDSLKETIRQKYFLTYGVTNLSLNRWAIFNKYDTLCIITTDGNSIHKLNAEWKILTKRSNSNFITLKCSNFNTWNIYSNLLNIYSWSSTDSISMKCTESVAAKTFNENKFEISAKGHLTSNFGTRVLLEYNTIQVLKHDSTAIAFKTGSLNVSALNLETSKVKTATIEFIDALKQDRSVRISIDGLQQTYQNIMGYNYYFW